MLFRLNIIRLLSKTRLVALHFISSNSKLLSMFDRNLTLQSRSVCSVRLGGNDSLLHWRSVYCCCLVRLQHLLRLWVVLCHEQLLFVVFNLWSPLKSIDSFYRIRQLDGLPGPIGRLATVGKVNVKLILTLQVTPRILAVSKGNCVTECFLYIWLLSYGNGCVACWE